MLLVGTRGYAHPDWVDSFYPAGTPVAEMLPLYARTFKTVLLDADQVACEGAGRLDALTPTDFRFTVALPARFCGGAAGELAALPGWLATLAPLRKAYKLACLLATLPAGLPLSPESKAFLLRLQDGVGEIPLVVEFGHKGWIVEGTEDWMRQHAISYGCVDRPRLPQLVQPISWLTGPIGWLRFDGRNYDRWDDPLTRHAYAYDVLELAEWLPKIEDLARAPQTLLYFANTPAGRAPADARRLQQLIQPR